MKNSNLYDKLRQKDLFIRKYLFEYKNVFHPIIGYKCSDVWRVVSSNFFKSIEKSNFFRRKIQLDKINGRDKNIVISLLHYKQCRIGKPWSKIMMHDNNPINSPFLKWAGGKLRLLNNIRKLFPTNIEGRYIEPFIGAGAVALNTSSKNTIINDINPDLILLYITIQKNIDCLIKECDVLFDGTHSDDDSYYKLREEFNTTAKGTRKAALFVYLNKHCFNGLCRYSKAGKFNTPTGKYKTINYPKDELKNASLVIKDWIIHNEDFNKIMNMAKLGDLVYCDPPYVPISNTSYFTSYSQTEFNWENQVNLAIAANEAAKRGAVVLVSNHETPETIELYKKYGAEIHFFNVSRSISAKSSSRKKARELIAVFKPN